MSCTYVGQYLIEGTIVVDDQGHSPMGRLRDGGAAQKGQDHQKTCPSSKADPRPWPPRDRHLPVAGIPQASSRTMVGESHEGQAVAPVVKRRAKCSRAQIVTYLLCSTPPLGPLLLRLLDPVLHRAGDKMSQSPTGCIIRVKNDSLGRGISAPNTCSAFSFCTSASRPMCPRWGDYWVRGVRNGEYRMGPSPSPAFTSGISASGCYLEFAILFDWIRKSCWSWPGLV